MADTVVLALDGSAKDERALAVAGAIAELTGAALHLVRVPVAGEDADAVRDALAALAGRLRRTHARDATVEVLAGDEPAPALVRHAAARRPLLVAMATRAAGTVGRTLRGSVADQVMRECPAPVLLVPPGTDDLAGRHVRFSRVLVPLDGSPLAARALDTLLRLPSAASLEYALLSVVALDRDRAAAAMHLATAVQHARAVGVTAVEIDIAGARDAAAAIVAAVREALVDIIAMSSRGHGGARRLVLGSVAEGVVRHADVPVLLLTPASLGA